MQQKNSPQGVFSENLIVLMAKRKINQSKLAKGSIAIYPVGQKFIQPYDENLIRPKALSRSPLSPDIPNDLAGDYRESALVLADSPKASAALSRRCLQHLLRDHAKVKPGNLTDEITEVLNSRVLPSHLAESLDAIRNIGNFAAHPMKSTSSGEILNVENGEAEWTLDVLESLFDFYFVQPATLKSKRTALDKKLADAGKKPMK
jgi:hypothetical protein